MGITIDIVTVAISENEPFEILMNMKQVNTVGFITPDIVIDCINRWKIDKAGIRDLIMIRNDIPLDEMKELIIELNSLERDCRPRWGVILLSHKDIVEAWFMDNGCEIVCQANDPKQMIEWVDGYTKT